MFIKRKRIHNVRKYLPQDVKEFYVGVEIRKELDNPFKDLQLDVGDRFVPSGDYGSVSSFNCEGRNEPLKYLPKESYTIDRWWEWSKANGQRFSGIVYDTRERYQRKFIPPPEIEIQLTNKENKYLYISRKLINNKANEEVNKHTINMFLEIFQECQILKGDFSNLSKQTPTNVKWELLPMGEDLSKQLNQYIEKRNHNKSNYEQKKALFYYESLIKAQPSKVSIGINGFSGYVAYEFNNNNICILENPNYGHATYILPFDWHEVSKLTKREILNNKYHVDRIIHDEKWLKNVKKHIEVIN